MIMNIASKPFAPRDRFLNALGWFMIIAGVAGVPVSALLSLFSVGTGFAAHYSDLIFSIVMLLGPSFLLITGLRMRKQCMWAAHATLIGLLLTIIGCAWDLVKEPHPASAYTGENGVMTSYTEVQAKIIPALITVLCTLSFVKLLFCGVVSHFLLRSLPHFL